MNSDELDLTVPACGNVRVRVRKDPTKNYSYLIEPAIWHPAVTFIGQLLVVYGNKTPQSLLENIELSTSNPINVESAIQYRKDRKGFDEKNAQIIQISSGKIKCCICLEKFKNQPEVVRFMCYRMHWICRTCYNGSDIKSCPLCRFHIRGKKYQFGVSE